MCSIQPPHRDRICDCVNDQGSFRYCRENHGNIQLNESEFGALGAKFGNDIMTDARVSLAVRDEESPLGKTDGVRCNRRKVKNSSITYDKRCTYDGGPESMAGGRGNCANRLVDDQTRLLYSAESLIIYSRVGGHLGSEYTSG